MTKSRRWIFSVALVCAASLALLSPAARGQSLNQQAEEQFQEAQQLQQSLDAEPQNNRTLADYKKTVAAYRKVYLLSSSAGAVTPALMSVAQLYHEMGDQFDHVYYQSAVVTYKFLVAQYPGSKFRAEALLQIGKEEKDDLHQPQEATDAFSQYLKQFPHSPQAANVREQLREIAEEPADAPIADASVKNANHLPQQPATDSDPSLQSEKVSQGDAVQTDADNSTATPGGNSSVTQIRSWNADDYTRVVVDLNGPVKYDSARIKNPDRIYFDLYKAHLGHDLSDKELAVQSGFLKSVRVAQNKAGVVRLVLDVDSIQGYSAFLLPNPYRLVIDVHGKPTDVAAVNTAPASAIGAGRLAGDREAAAAAPLTPPEKIQALPGAAASTGAPAQPSASASAASQPDNTTGASEHNLAAVPLLAAKPTHSGQRSLTRALGLKINRIVIDPGHGGHDTGTIGPDGLMEKNVCLDVALRLGKLIQKKLPGAQVVYTRKTDVFIPLEERTAIANQARADLFISIHANSSHDEAARGVETYYLSFTTSPEALETASRENALSDASVHQLQDLIQQIARNDKIEESHELATDIQGSLTTQLRQISMAERNRGVKKAPFVVLIGADMPSVLAEISFLSNRTDEHMLERSTQRERIAMGIFRGIEGYLSSLNSLNYDRQRQRLVSDTQPAPSSSVRDQK
ncbi:MAG TPA: N-acetylmuramoyl-L-alanine amidase [Candidatus Acidoferrales bacterium]|nr:N-acetylmuramoyl-L-alanine amidase [Candidatus Acidoferrales bacterium]